MKKVAAMILAAVALAALLGVVQSQGDPETQADIDIANSSQEGESEDVDLDFSKMNPTVQAAYLYKLAARPAEFEGKLLRLPGTFATTVDEANGKRYFGCVVGDAAGGCPCCSQTLLFEFKPKDADLWKTNFPPEKTFITITGTLRMVRETNYGQTYDVPNILECDVVIGR